MKSAMLFTEKRNERPFARNCNPMFRGLLIPKQERPFVQLLSDCGVVDCTIDKCSGFVSLHFKTLYGETASLLFTTENGIRLPIVLLVFKEIVWTLLYIMKPMLLCYPFNIHISVFLTFKKNIWITYAFVMSDT